MNNLCYVTLLWYTQPAITDLLKNVSSAIIFMDRLLQKPKHSSRFAILSYWYQLFMTGYSANNLLSSALLYLPFLTPSLELLVSGVVGLSIDPTTCCKAFLCGF